MKHSNSNAPLSFRLLKDERREVKAEGRIEGKEEERAELLQKVLAFFRANSYPIIDTIKMGKEVFNLKDKEIDGLLSKLNAKPGAALI